MFTSLTFTIILILKKKTFTCHFYCYLKKYFFVIQRYPVDGKSDGTETTSNFYHRLYYHILGTKQSEDVLAVEFSNEPKWKM